MTSDWDEVRARLVCEGVRITDAKIKRAWLAEGYQLFSGDAHTAAHVLGELPRYAGRALGPHGVIFGAPTKRTCCLHVVEARSSLLVAAYAMAVGTRATHARFEDRISPDLFWLHQDGAARIFLVGDDTLVLPDELLAALPSD